MQTMRTVRLLQKHRRSGRELERGAQITIPRADAEWLVEQAIAEPVGSWAPERAALLTAPKDLQAKDATQAPAAKPAARSGCCGQKWAR